MIQYPLECRFKLFALTGKITITDAVQQSILFIEQKIRLKEDVAVWTDSNKTKQLYRIRADRIIDFNATYTISDPAGTLVGTVQREGMRSLWKASYVIRNAAGQDVGLIHEENPWLKVLDGLLSEIPFGGMLINPAYHVDLHGRPALYLKKRPALTERLFRVERLGTMTDEEEALLLNGIAIFMLLEKARG